MCQVKSSINATVCQSPKFSLHFHDIVESIRSFVIYGNLPVNVLLEEFEETASIICWDDLQKLIFAKQSLRGLAKLFIALPLAVN